MHIPFGAILIRDLNSPPQMPIFDSGTGIRLVFTEQDKITYKPLLDTWGRENNPDFYNVLPADSIQLDIGLAANGTLLDIKPNQMQVDLFQDLFDKLPILDKVKQELMDALKQAQKP